MWNKRKTVSLFLVFISWTVVGVGYSQEVREKTVNLTKISSDCIDYQLRGGRYSRRKVALSSLASGATGIGSLVGAIVTAPTFAGPVIIGLYGGSATAILATKASLDRERRSNIKKIGGVLQDSYNYSEHIDGVQVFLKEFYDTVMERYPTALIRKKDIASSLVSFNESGCFCPKKFYANKGSTKIPDHVGDYAMMSFVEIIDAIFPYGVVVNPTTEMLRSFRESNFKRETYLRI